jgi:hypothetical protein
MMNDIVRYFKGPCENWKIKLPDGRILQHGDWVIAHMELGWIDLREIFDPIVCVRAGKGPIWVNWTGLITEAEQLMLKATKGI